MTVILMLIAVVLFLLAGLISIADLSGWNPHTLLYFGLCSWATAVLIGGAAPLIAKVREQ